MALTPSFVGLLLSLFFSLAPVPNERSSVSTWEASMAERMVSPPNPYQDAVAEPPGSLRDVQGPGTAPVPESSERRWFDLEDSGDWMGLNLHRLVRAGLQVEFTGYAEDPPQSRRMTNMKWDPWHPRYLLTTAGVQVRF